MTDAAKKAKADKKKSANKSGKKSGAKTAGKAADKAAKAVKKLAKFEDRAEALQRKLDNVVAKIADLGGGATRTASEKPVSPFARPFPDLPAIGGVRFAAAEAGVRYKGRTDLMLAEIAPGSAVAGVFTTSATRSAPVDWSRERLKDVAKAPPKGPLGIVVNSGNANAFTGAGGMGGVEATAKAAAKAVGGAAKGVFVASTGVIGEALPFEKVTAKLAEMKADLSEGSIRAAAEAIMTTDTYPKGAGRVVSVDGVDYRIAGIAKGSGMIAPDMATMLGFVFTDAPIGQRLLQSMLSEGTTTSFNAATVDSDTSTSDTVILAATGAAGGEPIASRRDPRAKTFEAALDEVLVDLAQQIVRDGEGISKFVTIRVTGARSDRSAAVIGRSVANSPLVKTAIAAADPNWGRIVAAVGKAGEPADRDRLSIRFGDVLVAEKGWVAETYSEADGAAHMKGDEIEITVDLGLGAGSAEIWTCDFTSRYFEINADYRS